MKEELRHFRGYQDEEAIILLNAFPDSPVVVSGGVGLVDDLKLGQDALLIEGPRHQLKFLLPRLASLRNDSIDSSVLGFWSGAHWGNDGKNLELYYVFGISLRDRIELLTEKFRRDMISSCQLMLSETSSIVVKLRGEIIVHQKLNLPLGAENGIIKLPKIAVPPKLFI